MSAYLPSQAPTRMVRLADTQSGMIVLYSGTFWRIISIEEPWDPRAYGMVAATFDIWIESDKRWSRVTRTFNPSDPRWSVTPLDDDEAAKLFGEYL